MEVADGTKLARTALPQEAPPQTVCANVAKTPAEQQPEDQKADETGSCEIPA